MTSVVTQVTDHAKAVEYASVSFTVKDVMRRGAEDGYAFTEAEAEAILKKHEYTIMEDAHNAGLDTISGLIMTELGMVKKHKKGTYVDAYA